MNIVMDGGHNLIKRHENVLSGVSERMLTTQSDDAMMQLRITQGDLHLLCVTNFQVGSSFCHLDDNALAALGYEIQRYFDRKSRR